jgi:opacity protein-like surface antigen
MLLRIAVITSLLLPTVAAAQFYSGQPKWEFGINGIYQLEETSGGAEGSSFKMDNTFGFGVTLNYNINRRFAVGGDFEWFRPDYRATLVSEDDPSDTFDIRHTATQFNTRFKGTVNFVEEGPFIPYAQLGIGWSSFDSNVADGPPQTGCWWHPWWGYICQNFYRTYSSTEFSYGGALGLRYEIAGNSFLNLSYDYWELDTSGDRAKPVLAAWRLQWGWRF